MKISTRGRYGVRAMFELAINYGRDPITIKNISERQGISENYLEQIFGTLRKGKLIKSIRGAKGGYVLSKDPIEITIGEIIDTLEGPVEISECLVDSSYCKSNRFCPTRDIWKRVQESVNEILYSVTLKDMIDDYNKWEKEGR